MLFVQMCLVVAVAGVFLWLFYKAGYSEGYKNGCKDVFENLVKFSKNMINIGKTDVAEKDAK